MKKTFVIALGGNAIIKENQRGTIKEQYDNIQESCEYIINLVEKGHNIVITHGNGPQIGNLLIQKDMAKNIVPDSTIDVCVSETQGQLGYMINIALQNSLKKRNIKKQVVSILTQVLVDEDDPGFQNPTKPIGPFYSKEEAKELSASKGYQMVEDSGRGYRRVVASPRPKQILEAPLVKSMLDMGHIVITCGGGGIALVDKDGRLEGVEAVIDKDFASALLANNLQADVFAILTGVNNVSINYGKENQKNLYKIKKEDIEKYYKDGHFPVGSMGPKVKSAINYLNNGGEKVIITSIESLASSLSGKEGTIITN